MRPSSLSVEPMSAMLAASEGTAKARLAGGRGDPGVVGRQPDPCSLAGLVRLTLASDGQRVARRMTFLGITDL